MGKIDMFEWEEPGIAEDEDDLSSSLQEHLENTSIHATDWTIETVISQISKGRIQLNPSFQRRDAWTDRHKTSFIESVILGFPVPQLVLAEVPGAKGNFIVIDGKQRLLSIAQFSGDQSLQSRLGNLKLRKPSILPALDGLTFEDFKDRNSSFVDQYENSTIRTVVIRNWKDENLIYHIFLRLNTGSVRLSPQELRNALHPGPFASFVDEYSSDSRAMRRILNSDEPDFRMRDAELLLRYIAFANFVEQYSGSMKDFLDKTTFVLNSEWRHWQHDLRDQCARFEDVVGLVFTAFDGDAFKKWKNGKFEGRFNRAVFDVFVFYAKYKEYRDLLFEKPLEVKDAFVELSDRDPEFIDSLESTTKSLSATSSRLGGWGKMLNERFGSSFPVVEHDEKRRALRFS
jgi:hypothetical protein